MDAGLTLNTEMMLVLGLIVFTIVMFTLEWVRAEKGHATVPADGVG